MKKIIVKIFLFFFFLFLLDSVIGTIIEKIYFKLDYGKSGAIINYFLEQNSDIIILGDSRAQHHYIPKIITQGLNLSCYNAGSDGASIYYSYCLLLLMLDENKKPDYLIYEINPNEFYFRNNEANRIKDIFPYYRRDKKIYKLLCQIDPYFRIKKVSKIYLYNQKIFSIFKSYIKKQKVNVSGYRPLYESNMEKIITNYNRKFNVIGNNKNSPKVINTLAKQIFTQFVELCKQNNINLIIIYSPRYSLTKSNINQFPDELINILKKNGLITYTSVHAHFS